MQLWLVAVAIGMWFAGVFTGNTATGSPSAMRLPMAYYARAERLLRPDHRGLAAVRPGIGADYSPSARSGVRSRGSASSISLVKMRSERL